MTFLRDRDSSNVLNPDISVSKRRYYSKEWHRCWMRDCHFNLLVFSPFSEADHSQSCQYLYHYHTHMSINTCLYDNWNNSWNSSKLETSIQCCLNVGPASHTVTQHSANRETRQCVHWGPSECVPIWQTNNSVFKSTKAQCGIPISKIWSLNSEV